MRQLVHHDHPEELGRRLAKHRGDADLAAFLVERGDERGMRTAGAAQVLACNLQIRR